MIKTEDFNSIIKLRTHTKKKKHRQTKDDNLTGRFFDFFLINYNGQKDLRERKKKEKTHNSCNQSINGHACI